MFPAFMETKKKKEEEEGERTLSCSFVRVKRRERERVREKCIYIYPYPLFMTECINNCDRVHRFYKSDSNANRHVKRHSFSIRFDSLSFHFVSFRFFHCINASHSPYHLLTLWYWCERIIFMMTVLNCNRAHKLSVPFVRNVMRFMG